MCGENQPDEDSRLDRECLIFEGTRIVRHKKQKLSIAASRSDREPKPGEPKSRSYSFSVLPSYFTVPFLSFWRETSSLV
jgi:hypothetical protein